MQTIGNSSGSPVVRTLCSCCLGPGFNLCLGSYKIPEAVQHGVANKGIIIFWKCRLLVEKFSSSSSCVMSLGSFSPD